MCNRRSMSKSPVYHVKSPKMWYFIFYFVAFVYFSERNIAEAKKELSSDGDIFAKIKEKPSEKKAKYEKSEQTTINSVSDLDFTLPQEYANDTIKEDSHKFYDSTFYESPLGKSLWIDIDKMEKEQVITNQMLSNSHRQAMTIKLSFSFPFYGSMIDNVTIATGGFLYMGDYIHNWIAATQYVAPLMANFDTSLSLNSTIKYVDNGTQFTVQWDKVYVQESKDGDPFTFQVTLFQNGDICFAYRIIPFDISKLSDEIHPVKVGISDAYIIDRVIYFLRRKTIYEYHRVDMKKNRISNDTALYFKALPTCLSFKDCTSCMNSHADMGCGWCSAVRRCSDGIDRQRQSWIVNGCDEDISKDCSIVLPDVFVPSTKAVDATSESHDIAKIVPSTDKSTKMTESVSVANRTNEFDYGYGNGSYYIKQNSVVSQYIQEEEREVKMSSRSGSIGIGAIISVILLIIALTAVGAWIFYAYRFPQSSSGQFLIKYRPSQWSFKQDEPISNADTFHM